MPYPSHLRHSKTSRRPAGWRALAALALVCTGAAGVAQDGPGAAQPSPDQEPSTTISVDVNYVNLYFDVKDKHNGLVPGLTRDDFTIFEDGKPQTVKSFKAVADQPLTLGLLLDTSGSEERMLPVEKEVAAGFMQSVLRPKDEAFLISFDVDVDLLSDFTSQPHELRAAMDKAHINAPVTSGGLPGLGGGTIPTMGTPRGTLLYDAIYLAADEKLSHEVGRKAMIIVTDGEDQGSKMRLNEAIEAAQKSDSIVYVLLVYDRFAGSSEMHKICEETGGRVIDVGRNEKKLREAFDQIQNELRTQYNVAYASSNRKLDGTYRKIEIKNKEGYKVQARKGYYALKKD